jgi:hypothetical protein
MHEGFWRESQKERNHWERPTCICENNIKVDIREIECNGLGWSHIAQNMDRWRSSCEDGNEFLGPTECWEIIE